MPKFRELSREEIEALERKSKSGPSQRELTRQKYIEYLKPFGVGATVEAALLEGENRTTERNRILRAAEELGYELEFYRTRDAIKFKVLAIKPKDEDKKVSSNGRKRAKTQQPAQ